MGTNKNQLKHIFYREYYLQKQAYSSDVYLNKMPSEWVKFRSILNFKAMEYLYWKQWVYQAYFILMSIIIYFPLVQIPLALKMEELDMTHSGHTQFKLFFLRKSSFFRKVYTSALIWICQSP